MELDAEQELFRMKTRVEEQSALQTYQQAQFETKKVSDQMGYEMDAKKQEHEMKYQRKELELEEEMLTEKIIQSRLLNSIQDALTNNYTNASVVNIGDAKDALDPAGQFVQMHLNSIKEVRALTQEMASESKKDK